MLHPRPDDPDQPTLYVDEESGRFGDLEMRRISSNALASSQTDFDRDSDLSHGEYV